VTGRTATLRLARFLIRRACRGLPASARQERYLEWTAELPAILDDSQIRSGARRAVRTLRFAAGQRRAAHRLARAAGISRRRIVTVRVAAAGVVAGFASLIAGLHIADHAVTDDSGPAVAGTVMAFTGAVALVACFALMTGMVVATGAGRLWHWLRQSGHRAPGGK
jgi:peptidoglycan/LPS O-acetylase OafA/YrhL